MVDGSSRLGRTSAVWQGRCAVVTTPHGTGIRRGGRHRWRPGRRTTPGGRTPMIRWLESGVIPSLIDCNRIWWDEDAGAGRGPRSFRTAGYLACPLNDP